MPLDLSALGETLRRVEQTLLDARTDGWYWEGHLSSSALSTATALFALTLFERAAGDRDDEGSARCRRAAESGSEWLIRAQNPDGGWGDTPGSLSNISTTALCWAALAASSERCPAALDAADRWLSRAAGSTEPPMLGRAIEARYGRDRTFSVPILTMCALAGRLGEGRDGWKLVPQLPFELAACPHQWFRWLRLPVVSYALPALIAMGLARHVQHPTGNPLLRIIRGLTRRRALSVLETIQPSCGGFLEATPLTSFVVMSLVAAGEAEGAVARSGVEFLLRSAREDGSWPIDTNLSTWVTTLSINALTAAPGSDRLGPHEREELRCWLLAQQYWQEHPYTHAAPGGWAWTDLPGGVPDADDTAGALLALRNLGLADDRVRDAAASGTRWLLALQNRDGGIPTFCRGWGALPFDRSGADLTAHAVRAWCAWRLDLPDDLRTRVDAATIEGVGYLAQTQRPDGSWLPLWFGDQHALDDQNPTYGTSRVLAALVELDPQTLPEVSMMLERGTDWLLAAQNRDGGWGGDHGCPSVIEDTALALQALARVAQGSPDAAEQVPIAIGMRRGATWLIERTDRGRSLEPAPIGFYFARLWYSERLYPAIFMTEALSLVRGVLAPNSSSMEESAVLARQ